MLMIHVKHFYRSPSLITHHGFKWEIIQAVLKMFVQGYKPAFAQSRKI